MTEKSTYIHGPFAQKLWEGTADIIQKIVEHPFCRGLAKGDLPFEAFNHYLSQDMLYIVEDARALALTAGNSITTDQMYFFLAMAKDGLDIERLLHKELRTHFDISAASNPSPACKQYSDFLLGKARHDAYEVSVAALLPCFWVYGHTSQSILKQSIKQNPYQKWLDTYSDESFAVYVNQFISIADQLMEQADESLRQRMIDAFRASTRFEYLFFDEAWKTPVG